MFLNTTLKIASIFLNKDCRRLFYHQITSTCIFLSKDWRKLFYHHITSTLYVSEQGLEVALLPPHYKYLAFFSTRIGVGSYTTTSNVPCMFLNRDWKRLRYQNQ
jgi:hypothetical protein